MNRVTVRPSADTHRLAAYVADLELEVDRLRKQAQFVRQAVQDALKEIARQADAVPADGPAVAAIATTAADLGGLLDELRVSDNGLGLPAGEREHLFELLYRAAPARAAGLGVGLAVAKLLVEQSGGTLTVDSGEGQGSTFTVVLPPYDLDDHLGSGAP